MWDTVTTRECQTSLKGHTDWVFSLTWIEELHLIASGSQDNTVRLWDTTGSLECQRVMAGHTDNVWSLAWLKAVKLLASPPQAFKNTPSPCPLAIPHGGVGSVRRAVLVTRPSGSGT